MYYFIPNIIDMLVDLNNRPIGLEVDIKGRTSFRFSHLIEG